MAGFHPEEALTRWRERIGDAATPREQLDVHIDAVLAIAALIGRRASEAKANELRLRPADALHEVFEEFATECDRQAAHAAPSPLPVMNPLRASLTE